MQGRDNEGQRVAAPPVLAPKSVEQGRAGPATEPGPFCGGVASHAALYGNTGRAVEATLVVPAFNESGRLEAGLNRLFGAIAAGAIDPRATEVLLVDDASTDDTATKAAKLLAHLPNAGVLRLDHHRGKGACVRVGLARASGRRTAFADADMAIDPLQIPALFGALDHAEVAIGARGLESSSVDVADTVRTVGATAFNRFVNLVAHVALADTQCGFKAFKTPVGRLLFHLSDINRFAFDVEVLAFARRLDLRIAEVPVRWRRVGDSSIRLVRDAPGMMLDVVKSRWRRPAPVPGLTLRGPKAPLTDLQERLGWRHLVVRSPGGLVVLFPLSTTEERLELTQRLQAEGTCADIEPTTFGIEDLVRLRPISTVEGRR